MIGNLYPGIIKKPGAEKSHNFDAAIKASVITMLKPVQPKKEKPKKK